MVPAEPVRSPWSGHSATFNPAVGTPSRSRPLRAAEARCPEHTAGREASDLLIPAQAAVYAPWQRLNFLPEPHQQGSLRPTELVLGLHDRDRAAGGAPFPCIAIPFGLPPAAAMAWAPATVSCW